jgi:hypothetical protein
MLRETRLAALRATAKVALSFTVGCGGAVLVPEGDTNEEPRNPDPGTPGAKEIPARPAPAEPAPTATSPSEPVPVPAPELACDAPPPGEPVSGGEEQLACCADHLAPIVPSDKNGWNWESWEKQKSAPDAQACCNVVLAHTNASQNPAWDMVGWDTLSACCYALGNPSGPACTPWGPPVPPAVRVLPDLDRLLGVA